VIELASFHHFSAIHQIFLDQLSESIGVVLNMIIANMRTEQLLRQSQQLAQELQNQSAELTGQQQALRITNAALERQALELEEKARLLEEQNSKVEEKNREVEQARKSLEDKAGQLALVSKYKSEFLANMSHELRTPLNSLLVLAKVLSENKDGNLSDRQLEYARTIYTSGDDLLRLINEVLDLSKMEAGKLQIEPREVSLGELARMLEKNFRPLADEKGLDFFVEVSGEAPGMVETDPQRLEQVMRNLLSNAIKFTESGWIKLRIAPVELAVTLDGDSLREGDRAIAFSVIDTGIGIAREKQKIIFEAFQQAEGGTSRKYGGTGLGLSISREIARALGGTIEVFSSLGQGSTFTLYLPHEYPREAANPADAVTNGAAIGPGDGAGGTLEIVAADGTHLELAEPVIVRNGGDSVASESAPPTEGRMLEDRKALIVDDDSRNIFAIKTLLERYGMRALEAADGRAAIALIERNPDLDVVLMDIMMPEMDGYETIRRIRGNATHRHLPVIAVTAKAFKEDRERCIEAGASDYLAKPVDESALIRAIRMALGDARAAADGPAV
jgi:signal transduction histidine kinase/ActR/RegA family two-component response regulator